MFAVSYKTIATNPKPAGGAGLRPLHASGFTFVDAFGRRNNTPVSARIWVLWWDA
ncbi:MAG: hypothetical protein ACRD4O_01935 [Bryobacteraceae bacterium]